MRNERQKGLTLSALVHFLWLLLVVFGLPMISRDLPPEPMAITVELLPITSVTNIKPSDSPPAKEEKPEDKKADTKKPTPPVKTAEATPPPPAPDTPSDVVKEKKPEEDKKEDEKKDPKKAKLEDLEAVLKAVRESADKEKKDKEKAKESSKSKSNSTQYNESLPMSLSEKDAIRSQIAKCWSVPAGAKEAFELVVVLNLKLQEDGTVIQVELASASKSRYKSDTFFRAAADSAIRAVRQCSPLQGLPPEKYGTWREIEMTFDPKEMLF